MSYLTLFLKSIKVDCIIMLTTYMKTLSQRSKSLAQNHPGNWSPSGCAKWCHPVSPDSEKSIPRCVCVCVCVNNLITLVNQELQGWYSSLFKNYIEFSGVWENKNSFVCFLVRSISSRVLNPYCCQSAYPISLTLSIFLLPRNIPHLSSVIKMSLPLLIFWWLHPLVLKE